MALDPLAAAKAAAAALAARNAAAGAPTAAPPPNALAAAKAAAAALAARKAAAASSAAAAAPSTSTPLPSDTAAAGVEAAKRMAAQLAQKLAQGGGASSSAAPPPAAADADAAKRAAAAAFAAKIGAAKRPRWGDGPSALAERTAPTEGKAKQALMVSQLSDSLALFRKDRGTEVATATKLTLKLPVPEPPEGRQPPNWIGIFIGREGINRARFEKETGARIFLRGRGTSLRGSEKVAEEDQEPMYVLIEAETQDALDAGRVDVLARLDPKQQSSSLILYDAQQIATAALEKTTDSEECAFCGKPGHHHSKCPKRTSTFKMAGVWCSGCGASGHSLRDCKGDKSNVVKLTPNVGSLANATKGEFEDDEFAAFQRSIQGQQNFHGLSK